MNSESIEFPAILDGEDKSSPLKNRIRKNYRHVRKWAKRTRTNCFRIYDNEVPYYPLAIDYYDGRYCVHYFSRSRDEEEPSPALVDDTNAALMELFGIDESAIYWRSRIRRSKRQQYEKQDEQQQFFTCLEYGVKFRINLTDYLDTGLFLDHRETRQRVARLAKGKRLLNLFAYTCSFSVHAALAGASYTKSVDLSNTYTQWGRENFEFNGIDSERHPIVRADCLRFLGEEIASGERYDLIVIDPPTLSRSKKMDQFFDVQVDYVQLISEAMELLNSGGLIIFSTNSRRFKFVKEDLPPCDVREVSDKTLPLDFSNAKIHHCWEIRPT